MLCECPLFDRQREDAAAVLGLEPPSTLEQYKLTTQLLPTFCMAAKEELSTHFKKSAERGRGNQANNAMDTFLQMPPSTKGPPGPPKA